ncbi:MAG: hypothetical protein ACYCQJ_04020 [Nitrososphaerales archaeon]
MENLKKIEKSIWLELFLRQSPPNARITTSKADQICSQCALEIEQGHDMIKSSHGVFHKHCWHNGKWRPLFEGSSRVVAKPKNGKSPKYTEAVASPYELVSRYGLLPRVKGISLTPVEMWCPACVRNRTHTYVGLAISGMKMDHKPDANGHFKITSEGIPFYECKKCHTRHEEKY